ncbi:MAG: hypothetical protein SGPRY_008091 [Prymnesium sp.]
MAASLLSASQLRGHLGEELSEQLSRKAINALIQTCDDFAAELLARAFHQRSASGSDAELRGTDITDAFLGDERFGWLRSAPPLRDEPVAANSKAGFHGIRESEMPEVGRSRHVLYSKVMLYSKEELCNDYIVRLWS